MFTISRKIFIEYKYDTPKIVGSTWDEEFEFQDGSVFIFIAPLKNMLLKLKKAMQRSKFMSII